jgi:hypothetical protein
MRKQTRKPAAPPTPKQRKTQGRSVRYNARCLALCNSLEFWQRCHVGACRRNRSCRGDMHACFARHWRAVPEDVMVFVRARLDASEQGLAPAAAVRAAIEARTRHLQWRG